MKPVINEAFFASSGDIITDYKDLYCLFMRCIASRRVNITMSAFVIAYWSIPFAAALCVTRCLNEGLLVSTTENHYLFLYYLFFYLR